MLQIGVLQSLPCICCIVGAPIFGAISDALQQQRKIHYFLIFSGAFFVYVMKYIEGFYVMCFATVIANIISSPIGPFLDECIMSLIDREGGEYGKNRLFGGVGYGLGAYMTGKIIEIWNISWMFNVHIVTAYVSSLILYYIPPPTTHVKQIATGITNGLGQLRHKPDLVALLGYIFIMGMVYGIMDSFLALYLFNLSKGNSVLVGIAIVCNTTSELPVFFLAEKIIAKLGTTGALSLATIAYAIRLWFYSTMVDPWTVLPVEWLHGITYSLSWTTYTKYVYASADQGTKGTMMGVLSSAFNGYGKAFGTLVGGFVYHHFGAKQMWRGGLAAILFGGLLLCVFHWYSKQLTKTRANMLSGEFIAVSPAVVVAIPMDEKSIPPNETSQLLSIGENP